MSPSHVDFILFGYTKGKQPRTSDEDKQHLDYRGLEVLVRNGKTNDQPIRSVRIHKHVCRRKPDSRLLPALCDKKYNEMIAKIMRAS